MTPPIIGFIGWHDSGKTTLVSQVVRHLRANGLNVGVIKSSKDQGIAFGAPDTDTSKHRRAGADPVVFVAPDQVVLLSDNHKIPFREICSRYFDRVDLIIAEGFKDEPSIPKIEVFRGADLNPLREQAARVIGVASDTEVSGLPWFPLNRPQDVAQFIQDQLPACPSPPIPPRIKVTLNGQDQELSPELQAQASHFLSQLSVSQPLSPPLHTLMIQIVNQKEQFP